MLNILTVSLIIAIFVMICMTIKSKDSKLQQSPEWAPWWIKDMRMNDTWWEVADLQPNGRPWYPSGPQLLKVNQAWTIPASALTLYTDKH